MPRHKATAENPAGLTLAECRVMAALVRLGSTKAVARELGYTYTATAQNHITNAMRKLNAPNRVVAAVLWDRRVRADHRFVGYRSNIFRHDAA